MTIEFIEMMRMKEHQRLPSLRRDAFLDHLLLRGTYIED